MKRGGCDRIVVGFTTAYATVPFTTEVVNSNPVHHAEYSIQHNVIKFVSDLRQVGGFLLVIRFSPPMKLAAMI